VPGCRGPVVAVAGSDGGRRVGGRITATTGTSSSDRRSSLSSPLICANGYVAEAGWEPLHPEAAKADAQTGAPQMTTQLGPHATGAPTPRQEAEAARPGGYTSREASAFGFLAVQRLRLCLRMLLVIAVATVVVLALCTTG
jgi:hypothetical protein